MEITKPKLSYSVCSDEGAGIPVIIVAAGSSSRMNGADKLFLQISGIPVIVRTLLCFERSGDISKIIVVTKEQSVNEIQILAEKYMINKVTDIVVGSETRQKSVLCGLKMLDKNENKVLVSDGARMFVTKKMISDCVNMLKCCDGCLCALKVNDTVKKAIDGKVEATVDREALYLAQTPQGITVSSYLKAIAGKDASLFTDDASVLEEAGYDVRIVPGNLKNIKITTPEDVALAEIYAKEF